MIADDEEAAAGTITARPLGADEVRTTYDRLGRKAASTDPRGVVHTCSYAAAGRLASGAATTLPTGVDGAVRRMAWACDGLGRVSAVTSYDAATGGNVVNQTASAYGGWCSGSPRARTTALSAASPRSSARWTARALSASARQVRLHQVGNA